MNRVIILEIIESNPSHFTVKIKKQLPDFYNFINNNVSLDRFSKFSEKLYNWLYQEQNKCIVCSKETAFRSISRGYAAYCSAKCNSLDPSKQEQRKKTLLQRYGVDNPSKSLVIQQRKTETLIKNYGVEHQMHSNIVKQRLVNTVRERYGVNNSFQSEEIKGKIKNTLLSLYGVDNPSKSKDFQRKKKETNNKLYGSDFYNQSDEFKEWHKHNRMKKILAKFTHIQPLFSVDDYAGVTDKLYKWECKKCSNVFSSSIDNGNYPICPVCYPPMYSTSIGEEEVADLIKSFGFNIERNSRKIIPPFELDIFVPTLNIAIEYCGLYWHSEENKKEKYYHKNKWQMCKDIGIRLITIFEDEWLYRKNICISRLSEIFNIKNKPIYGRSCIVREIEKKETSAFLDRYHLQGDFSKSKTRLGLYNDEKLVSIMTFGHNRYSKEFSYELHRYCTSIPVIGGSKKLFSYFTSQYKPKIVISYCDLRWGVGNVYLQMGFALEGETSPGYYYTNKKGRENRLKYTKKKLIKMGYDGNLTEAEIMASLGYTKIWDCGNYKFVWTP